MHFKWSTKAVVLAGCALLGIAVIILAWLYWPTIKTAAPIGEHAGVYGKVVLEEGNCMPSIGGPAKSCRHSAVSRTIYFYKPPLTAETIVGAHYTGAVTPTATAISDKAGNYQINLPEGQYSVLVEDEDGPFCNGFSGTMACGITVTGSAQKRDITIDHATH